MSQSLEFYSVNVEILRRAIGSGDQFLLIRILRDTEPLFSEYYELEEFEGGPTFEQAVRAWILGPPPVPSPLKHLGEALGLIALIEHFGKLVGVLDHSMESGTDFADAFLHRVVPIWLRPNFPIGFLLNRPLLHYVREEYPFWGHLSSRELSTLSPSLFRRPPTGHQQNYIDEWSEQLAEALDWAIREQEDLVTVYG